MEVRELVRKALEYRGFTVVSDSIALVVRGVEDEYVVILTGLPESEAMDALEVEGKKLVISLKYDTEPSGDLFWSREDFERTIGMMLLDEALGMESVPDIISSFEDAFVSEAEPTARALPRSELGDDADGALVEITEYIPFHAIRYLMDGERPDSGVILVDAVDGSVYSALKPFENSMDIGENRREPVLSSESAADLAIDFLIEKHTIEVEEKVEMDGAVTVVEKRAISPSRDSIEHEYLGLLYLPVMFFEREEDTLAVDASGITGFRKHY